MSTKPATARRRPLVRHRLRTDIFLCRGARRAGTQQAYAEGDLRTAIIEIKNALQQDPSQAEARRLLGEYSLAVGNGAEAEAELVRAQDLGADPDQLRLPLLRAWLMQGKLIRSSRHR